MMDATRIGRSAAAITALLSGDGMSSCWQLLVFRLQSEALFSLSLSEQNALHAGAC